MSYAIPAIHEEAVVVDQSPADLIFVPRSRHQWVAFVVPLAMTFIGWQANVQVMTDSGFLIFTLICGAYLAAEFLAFPRRFGIGGLLLYGGTLCWFCQDYLSNWFNYDYNSGVVIMPFWVVAKAAFLYVLFIMLMSISLNWTIGNWAVRLLQVVPDPGNPNFYLWVVLILFGVALSPYVFFADEPIPLCIYHALFAGWTGPPRLIVYRTGNLNYSWGAYVAQLIQIGEVGGIVGIVYAILVARTWSMRLVGIGVWVFNALLALSTGRRGEIAFHLLPPIALLFIKFQAQTAAAFKKFSLKAYVVCGLLTVFLLFVVHFQGTFRGSEGGYNTADLSQIDITKNQGNTMFSEGLQAYGLVGVTLPYFYEQDFPGEGALIALPRTVFDLVVGMIPRALWHDKPVDALWQWYNQLVTGMGNGLSGTTISHGMVGTWYFKYGYVGMIEGALLVGWLMGVSERALQHSDGKPIHILLALGFAVWLFRTFRDFIFIDLYGLVLGAIFLAILVRLLRPIMGGGPASEQSA